VILGDVMSTGNSKGGVSRAAAYLDHLKTMLRVDEDQELARALGTTKGAVAQWRRRDAIPAGVQNTIAKQFGADPVWFLLEDMVYRHRWEDDAYAATLYILDAEGMPQWPSEVPITDRDLANLVLRGQVFRAVLSVVRGYVREYLRGVGSREVLPRLLAAYREGQLTGLEEAASTVPLPLEDPRP